MLNQEDVNVGDAVHYQPSHYLEEDKWENGIIKEIPEHTTTSVRVVYHCANDWGNYQNYNSALTSCRDLKMGWRK